MTVTRALRPCVRSANRRACNHEHVKASKRDGDEGTQTAIVSGWHGSPGIPVGDSSPVEGPIVIFGLCWKSGFSMLGPWLEGAPSSQVSVPIPE